MPARKTKLKLDVDERTESLSDAALICRTLGHKWEVKAQSRTRFQLLFDQGLREFDRYCGHGCGSTWLQVWDLRSKSMVENKRTYPGRGEYLMPTGSGRLSRGEAVIADAVRAGMMAGAL